MGGGGTSGRRRLKGRGGKVKFSNHTSNHVYQQSHAHTLGIHRISLIRGRVMIYSE